MAQNLLLVKVREKVVAVPGLIPYLSTVVTLLSGDMVFTGTPVDVGDPQGRCLEVGQLVESEIRGVGRLANLCV